MATIKTLVYFDLEATGLKSSGRPRISELSFVAIDAQEINIMNKKLSEKAKNITCREDILLLETLIPRVLNKLTMCVPNGYYNARGFQHYWFGQLQPYWSV